ncbi:GldG family protein [Leucothrix pacifica]|uniref:ABC transporter n=1 Tax=Leucothrix pacifica TaxID=1247513 RepID=A0A317C1L8_9GAMM|nr:Gldg family protein [Leucothrix pacifica]PWQ92259.1 ABC transporter [Leucothrix pacifica]
MNTKKPSAISHKLSQLLFYALLILMVVMVAWLSTRYVKTTDVSFGQRNTLTQATQSLVQSVEQPLGFVAYLSNDKTKLHDGMRKLVAKYQQFKPETTLEIVDPNLNPERAKADNVMAEGRVILHLGEQSEKLTAVDENTVANTIQRMLRKTIPRVIVLEGHQERSVFDEGNSGMSKLRERLSSRGFRLQPHNILKTQSIPEHSSFVMIASPLNSYLKTEVDVLLKYIEDGGNLLWLTEPRTPAGLDSLNQHLGLSILDGTLLDSNKSLQEMLGIQHPAVIPVIQFGHPLLKDMVSPALFPFATVVEKNTASQTDWSYISLLSSGENSWLETAALSGEVSPDYTSGDLPGPLSLAMTLTRDHLQKEQRIAVIGDSDFLLNQFVGAAGGGNLTLANKLFDWLSNGDQLLNIKPARAPDTVLAMPGKSLTYLALSFLIGIPALLILIGTLRWWIRKRR